MNNSTIISQRCATTLLNAWAEKNAALIGNFAAQAVGMANFCGSNSGESERLELIGFIAGELQTSIDGGAPESTAAHIKLLTHLAGETPVRSSLQ